MWVFHQSSRLQQPMKRERAWTGIPRRVVSQTLTYETQPAPHSLKHHRQLVFLGSTESRPFRSRPRHRTGLRRPMIRQAVQDLAAQLPAVCGTSGGKSGGDAS